MDTSNVTFNLTALGETELGRWVQKQVQSPAAKQATWRIAVGHHPGFTEAWSPGSCEEYQGSEPVISWFFPLLAQYDFPLYLTGHTHAYERGQMLGVTQIIAGGGGATLDTICRDLPQTQVVKIAYHYLDVEAGRDTLTVRAIEVPATGESLDEVFFTAHN